MDVMTDWESGKSGKVALLTTIPSVINGSMTTGISLMESLEMEILRGCTLLPFSNFLKINN